MPNIDNVVVEVHGLAPVKIKLLWLVVVQDRINFIVAHDLDLYENSQVERMCTRREGQTRRGHAKQNRTVGDRMGSCFRNEHVTD